ncbi:MAG: preprotein translocase subunit YajC [Actinomycetota bacterium]
MDLIFVAIVGVIFYAVLILPQQRRNREHKALLGSLEEGDEIVTNAGLYGFIAAVDGEVLWVEVAEGVELKLAKSSVASKIVVAEQDGEDD